jgi:hypothetical protein
MNVINGMLLFNLRQIGSGMHKIIGGDFEFTLTDISDICAYRILDCQGHYKNFVLESFSIQPFKNLNTMKSDVCNAQTS